MEKPGLPKGTRDFGPLQMAKRNFILDTIIESYKLYGFQQIETPSMEKLSVLTGKYGDEGDQLIFKILNSDNYLKKADKDILESDLDNRTKSRKLTPSISEKALRYDLTVPFARFISTNAGTLPLPFKRYQVQPVWRADRPQKGRYREFYQCDADVVGSDSLIFEADIIAIIRDVFRKLNITDYTIKLNHRKVLTAVAEIVGMSENPTALFVAIDKLDKIGLEKVLEELVDKGLSNENASKLKSILSISGGFESVLKELEGELGTSEAFKTASNELTNVLKLINESTDHLELDPTLARGLSYYTGCIFEVKVNNVSIGSVSGGGRYDNLTGIFGQPGLSGIGISFGVDRIYDVLEELDLFPETVNETSSILICHFDEVGLLKGQQIANQLRASGISSEVYPDKSKMKKQLSYANRKLIPYVGMLGDNEMEKGTIMLKDLASGEQTELSIQECINKLS